MKHVTLFAVAVLWGHAASAQWQSQHAGFSNDTLGFYEMSLPNDSTVWAVCYDGKQGLGSGRLVLDFTRTTNGGASWTAGKLGTDTTLSVSNISAISTAEAWVAMHKRAGTGGGLYRTTDGGLTWNQAAAGKIFDANSFPGFVHFFKDKSRGLAVGDPNGGYFEIYTTTDGGANWDRVTTQHLPATLPNEYGLISGFYALDSTIWFGTTAGRIWKSVNFGADWTAHVVDPTGRFVNEIAFNDDKLRGVTHVRNNQGGTFLYSTTDGGATWSAPNRPSYWKRSRVTAVPGTDALISTSVVPIDPGSAISYDNGTTWAPLDNNIPMAVCRFRNAGIGYAGSFFITGPPFNPGMYKSTITFQPRLSVAGSAAGAQAAADFASVYPTLANEVINISLKDGAAKATSVIHLLDLSGKVLETKSSKAKEIIRMDLGKLPPGQYMLRISNGGRTVSKAFTIAR